MNYVYSGTTKLKNIASYLAQELRLPEAAIDLKFRWPSNKTGKIHTVEGTDLNCPLTDLRNVWEDITVKID
jgi:hypothetical protein